MTTIIVREHARLTTGYLEEQTLLQRSIPDSAFDWLCKESQRLQGKGAALLQVEDRRWLRLDSYVGVVETPCGTRIEILPKHISGDDSPEAARRLLLNMLRRCLKLSPRDMGPTALKTLDMPVSEWIMHQFLMELDLLARRGIRFDYRPVEEEVRYQRGRLLVNKQLRQPPGRADRIHVEQQIFDADRAENRLIRKALNKVAKLTRDPDSWRRSHELEHLLGEIPPSHDHQEDFKRWRDDRLTAHYQAIRPWCALILGERNPLSMLGEWNGRSLLFPMERVFERYVEVCLRSQLPTGATLNPQTREHYLCQQGERPLFQLRPDFIIEYKGKRWVADAKWKLLEATDVSNNHGLSHADFYQLFAYGHKYLMGVGQMVLIYPLTRKFPQALEAFHFDASKKLSLEVIPLNLNDGQWHSQSLPTQGAPADQMGRVFAA